MVIIVCRIVAPTRSVHPEPCNVILFEIRIFADKIKVNSWDEITLDHTKSNDTHLHKS